MAPTIRHPEKNKNRKIRCRLFVGHGKCGNAANTISGYLIPKAGGANIKPVKVDRTTRKHWGLVFKKVPDGAYTLHVDETPVGASAAASGATFDEVDFTVAAAPIPPSLADVVYPATTDAVPATFYPYGTSQSNIVDPNGISFYEASTSANQQYATLQQQTDPGDGSWYGIVQNLDAWPTASSYDIDVSNGGGTATNTKITLSP
jgi:hypothetical protein